MLLQSKPGQGQHNPRQDFCEVRTLPCKPWNTANMAVRRLLSHGPIAWCRHLHPSGHLYAMSLLRMVFIWHAMKGVPRTRDHSANHAAVSRTQPQVNHALFQARGAALRRRGALQRRSTARQTAPWACPLSACHAQGRQWRACAARPPSVLRQPGHEGPGLRSRWPLGPVWLCYPHHAAEPGRHSFSRMFAFLWQHDNSLKRTMTELARHLRLPVLGKCISQQLRTAL